MPIIPALGRPRQENWEFSVSLSYIPRETLSQKEKKRNSQSNKTLKRSWMVP
jgi:hypothetical protein